MIRDNMGFHFKSIDHSYSRRMSPDATSYVYKHFLFHGFEYVIINPVVYGKAKTISWKKAEYMCWKRNSNMTTAHTAEGLEQIEVLLKLFPNLYIQPAMVYLNIQRKNKVCELCVHIYNCFKVGNECVTK